MVAQTEILLIAAAFAQPRDAQDAVTELKQGGFTEHDISVLYTDAGHTIRAGLLNGAIWGGALGAFFGLLFPPIGLLIAAGPVAGILASGAVTGVAGALTVGALEGIISGLVQLGLPHEVATSLGQSVHKGDTLVVVHASSEGSALQAKGVMERHNPRAEASPNVDGVVMTEARQA